MGIWALELPGGHGEDEGPGLWAVVWAHPKGKGAKCVSCTARISTPTVRAMMVALAADQWDIFHVPTRTSPGWGGRAPTGDSGSQDMVSGGLWLHPLLIRLQ